MSKTTLSTYYSITLMLLIPLGLIYSLWSSDYHNQIEYFANLLFLSCWWTFFYFSMPWGMVGYYIRYSLLFGFCLAAALIYITQVLSLPFLTRPLFSNSIDLALMVLLTLVAMVLLARVMQGFHYRGEAIPLAFPFRCGTYYVVQGGSNWILNHHVVNQSQFYASDIVQLNGWGSRARGIYPKDLTAYSIFERELYSPCDGVVVGAVDGFPDLVPPDADAEHAAGNCVAIATGQTKILLAHLRQGSVLVKVGETVVQGQPIAKVGNSGNTTEPHLHIHAERYETDPKADNGKGIPILFDGKFLRRNSIVRVL